MSYKFVPWYRPQWPPDRLQIVLVLITAYYLHWGWHLHHFGGGKALRTYFTVQGILIALWGDDPEKDLRHFSGPDVRPLH